MSDAITRRLQERFDQLVTDMSAKFAVAGDPRHWRTFGDLPPEAQRVAVDTYEAWVVREARAHPSENSSVPPLM